MKRKNNNLIKIGLAVTTVVSLAVIFLLFSSIGSGDSPGSFEVIVFVMSSTALILTIFQSIEIQKQLSETRRSSIELQKTDKDIEQLVKEEKEQNNLLDRDLELDKVLVEVLLEHGIEVDDSSAKKIRQKINKHNLDR